MGKIKKPVEDRILEQLKANNKLLREIREILNNMWRERLPGGE